MNAAHRPSQPAPARRWYSPDYRRKLRDAGAFRTLTASAQVALGALCDRANAAGVAWPTVETIARDHGLGESTVRRALGELVEAGLVLAVRRAGRVSRYVLVTPQAPDLTPVDPESDPSQIGPPPLSNRAPIMIRDQIHDHKNQHDSAEIVAPVVVEEEFPGEETAAASPPAGSLENEGNDSAITMLAPDVVDRARAIGLAPAKVNRYGSDRVRWVLDALAAAHARHPIGKPAGWVMQALRENWELPGAVAQHALPIATAAAAAARPPKGTCWARERGAAIALEVLDVNESRVQLAGGIAVPVHRWSGWEWFAEDPGAPADAREDAEMEDEGLMPADSELAPEKRADLARVSAWAMIRKRTPAELAAKLEAEGLPLDEWEVYQAAQAWLEAQT